MAQFERKTSELKLRLTPSDKQRIQQKAKEAGVTMSVYVLTQALEGDTTEFGTKRRKAEGPLINAKLYADLGRLLGLFNQRQKAINTALKLGTPPPSDQGELAEAIALLHEIRRSIALTRLSK